ncbi:MAG: glucosaminidase domain-containing protein, partial [Alphaproteobacteria bacterium]|nr:glucosaminidase domain-containing protein [Alphaproteobacteria bacterium]
MMRVCLIKRKSTAARIAGRGSSKMGVEMSYRAGASIIILMAVLSGPALAERLPAVQLTPANQPKSCTTPGRLMAFIRDRNRNLLPKFDKIAADYMRHGRDLGIRWDYAFFQMVVETNSLKFTGDVSAQQNNFAGLGATGGGVKGEAFRSVSDGVRAHQQHLMIYAGLRVDDPVADRTRKVQSWGILDKWRAGFRRPITFGDVGSKWAPYDRRYGNDIQTIADAFYRDHCNRPDPAPELLAEALGKTRQKTRAAFADDNRASLGVAASAAAYDAGAKTRVTSQPYTTLNAAQPPSTVPPATTTRTTVAKFAAPAIQPPPMKCRVWTASYGGQKAIIIRSTLQETTNYTVLDVNAGREEAETSAYIAAYAKGGERIANFASKSA